jgi:AcrR family transcriptional regulator
MQKSLGRERQKRRTRKALLDAANRLLELGQVPTIEDVAAEAMVSRATTYRYYSTVDALVADAFFERRVPTAEELFDEKDLDPVNRVLTVEHVVNDLLTSDETSTHIIVRNFIDAWLSEEPGTRTPRPGRRLPLLDAALEPFRSQLGESRLRRLRHALALTMGTEAVLALRDVCGLDVDEMRSTARWAATALVKQAFEEAAQA